MVFDINSYNKLLAIIKLKLNVELDHFDKEFLKRRLNLRLFVNGLQVDDFGSYIKLLETKSKELTDLKKSLRIHHTEFFRDIELWKSLQIDVFPKIYEEKVNKNSNTVFVWCAGCDTGEEPYTLAILLNELLKNTALSPMIIASDASDESLAFAKEGTYSKSVVQNIPSGYLAKYFRNFTKDHRSLYTIDNALKLQVKFVKHNYIKDTPPGTAFDMIFCRNILTYLKNEIKTDLILTFQKALESHGWLITGRSEIFFSKFLAYNFHPFNDIDGIFRKERRVSEDRNKEEKRERDWFGYKDKENDNK